MEKKPYSDPRWWDNPMPSFSDCGACIYHRGRRKCDKYPEGIPDKIMGRSFPRTDTYKKKYCKYRKTEK